ncbi:glycosyltransferase family 2 protein [Methylophaga sp.]|uniref:glycosyltransferase family 2 protein n=1 Tax=Methylophaga sp. TaxID=2024840 RepID=UPI003A8DDB4E
MEDNKTILSIVTVTLNCVDTLGRTLRSVEAIKNEDVEYLVIDGASTDGTLDLIKDYRHLIDQIVSEPDGGIYNAMNKGASLASGRYILFINGDDELFVEGFPAVIKAMKDGAADVICATTLVGPMDEPDEILVAKPLGLLFFNTIPHPSSFVKASLMRSKPFREDLRIVSDYDFFLQAYLERRSFKIVPGVTAKHQRGGVSGNQKLSADEIEQVRRERLGRWFYILEAGAAVYRIVKKWIG